MKRKIFLKQQLLKDTFAKRYNKGLTTGLGKREGMCKVLTNKELTDKTGNPFEKVEPHKKFNTQWGTVYSRDLAEFIKDEKTSS